MVCKNGNFTDIDLQLKHQIKIEEATNALGLKCSIFRYFRRFHVLLQKSELPSDIQSAAADKKLLAVTKI